MNDDLLTISQETTFQGVTIWLGDENPVTIDDQTLPDDVVDLIGHPFQRVVTVARLRAIVAVLEKAALEDELGIPRPVAVTS